MINILFLTYSMNIGGTENHLLHVVTHLDRKKFNPIVCCLYDIGSLGEMLSNNQNIGIYKNVLRNKWDIMGFLRLLKIFKNENIHILYMVNSPITLGYGIVCAKLTGVKSCLTRMTATNPIYHRKRRRIINRAVLPFLNRVIAQAPSHKEYLIRGESFKPEKITVIYNGVNLARFNQHIDTLSLKQMLSIPVTAPVIGIVARLAPEKGLVVFLKAASKIINKFPQAHFVIVGDGPEREMLEKEAHSLSIKSNVQFLGARKDIPQLIELFDIAVLTSYPRVETFSNSILEYMAAAKPVVSTNVGSIDEQVQDGETGILIQSGDSNALADAVLSLLADNSLAKKMGEAGRKKVKEKFTIEEMIARYESLFTELAE